MPHRMIAPGGQTAGARIGGVIVLFGCGFDLFERVLLYLGVAVRGASLGCLRQAKQF